MTPCDRSRLWTETVDLLFLSIAAAARTLHALLESEDEKVRLNASRQLLDLPRKLKALHEVAALEPLPETPAASTPPPQAAPVQPVPMPAAAETATAPPAPAEAAPASKPAPAAGEPFDPRPWEKYEPNDPRRYRTPNGPLPWGIVPGASRVPRDQCG